MKVETSKKGTVKEVSGRAEKFTSSASLDSSEDDPHETPKRGRRPKKERRGGYRRGAMKYPFRTIMARYLEKREVQVGKSTLANERRMLAHLIGEIESGAVKNLTSKNPYNMSKKDVRAIIDHLRGRDLENETIERYLRYLNSLLVHCDNHALEELKQEAPHLFPKRARKPIHYLTEKQVRMLIDTAQGMKGWNGAVTRLMTVLYPGTGLRVSELLLAHMEDLDTSTWTMKVRDPKGKGSYGQKRTVTVMPPFRSGVLAYLEERRKHLEELGMDSVYLIPALVDGKDVPYSTNHLRELKRELEKASGIKFKLKDFRATFASLTVQMDPNLLPDVSKQLGHSSVVVTETFYAATKADDSGRRLEEAWMQKAEMTDSVEKSQKDEDTKRSKPVLIKPEKYMSGYA